MCVRAHVTNACLLRGFLLSGHLNQHLWKVPTFLFQFLFAQQPIRAGAADASSVSGRSSLMPNSSGDRDATTPPTGQTSLSKSETTVQQKETRFDATFKPIKNQLIGLSSVTRKQKFKKIFVDRTEVDAPLTG